MISKVFLVAFLAVLYGGLHCFALAAAAAPLECDTRKTLNGGCCVFPFTYRGKKYYDCTTKDSGKEWCATTADYDADGQWAVCDKAPAPIFDVILESNKNESARSSYGFESLFQGDIIVDDGIRNYLDSRGLTLGWSGRSKRAVMRNKRRRWITGGKLGLVPYRIEASNARARGVIERAMRHWESKVPCLRFIPWKGVGSYLSFFSGGGCYSMVGRQRSSGPQRISIGRGCEHMGVVAHEIGHALGFWHEQSRPDRDRYVKINWGNIQRGMAYNFHKYDTTKINSRGIPYDYNSLMHYSSTAFANRRGVYTIEGRNGRKNLGQRYGLSDRDVQQARLLYCGGNPRPPTPRPPRPPTLPPSVCRFKDHKYWCPYWKNRGLCTSGPTARYMRLHCRKSCECGQTQPCRDVDRQCPSWKSLGYCTHRRYGPYVRTYCRKSCRVCR